MKLSGLLLTLVLLTFVMLAAASPPVKKVKQSVVASHVQPVEAVGVADVTAPVMIKEKISIAKDDNSVVGANTIDRENEVAARARSGVKGATAGNLDSTLNYKSRRIEADIGSALLL